MTTATMTKRTGIFSPRNKSYYKGKFGRRLMSMAGQRCIIVGEVVFPANATGTGEEKTVLEVRFPGSTIVANVRPCDVIEDEMPL